MNKVIYRSDNITVEDNKGIRGLFVDGLCQGRADVDTFNPESWYFKNIYTLLENSLFGFNVLMLGGGAGILSRRLTNTGYTVSTVEKNPVMFHIANAFFDYKGHRNYTFELTRDNIKDLHDKIGKFSIVISDMFDGHTKTGPHDSLVFKELVSENGILISNHGDKINVMVEPI